MKCRSLSQDAKDEFEVLCCVRRLARRVSVIDLPAGEVWRTQCGGTMWIIDGYRDTLTPHREYESRVALLRADKGMQ